MHSPAWIATLALSLLLPGCAEKQSKRCEEICKREAECAEALGNSSLEVNRAECVKICSELDKEPQGAKLVSSHQQCVEAAGDNCDTLLRCD